MNEQDADLLFGGGMAMLSSGLLQLFIPIVSPWILFVVGAGAVILAVFVREKGKGCGVKTRQPYVDGFPVVSDEGRAVVQACSALDWNYGEGCLDLRTGGDGDNGEFLAAYLTVLIQEGAITVNYPILADIEAEP